MLTFDTVALALADIEARPNYVPGSLHVQTQQPPRDDGTHQQNCTIYIYKQEVPNIDGIYRGYRNREAVVVETYTSGGGDAPVTVSLSYSVVSETVEGMPLIVSGKAGPQRMMYALDSCAFELPSDADVVAFGVNNAVRPRGCHWIVAAGTPAVDAAPASNYVTSYHRYQIPEVLDLGDVAAQFENLPRFTLVEVDTGFYTDATPTNEASWHRMGGFTRIGGGVTLSGTCSQPSPMPPSGTWTEARLVPSAPIKLDENGAVVNVDGIPEIDYAVAGGDYTHLMTSPPQAAVYNLYVRIKVTRTHPCYKDGSQNEIRPYIDIDWDFTKSF